MGRRINSKAIHTGRNADEQAGPQPYPPGSTTGPATWRDDRFVRCSRCGFICHLDRDRRAPEGSREGWGVNYTAVDNDAYNADIGYNDYFTMYNDEDLPRHDPVVAAGCPQCGTLLYDK